jgi:hypothetical protein
METIYLVSLVASAVGCLGLRQRWAPAGKISLLEGLLYTLLILAPVLNTLAALMFARRAAGLENKNDDRERDEYVLILPDWVGPLIAAVFALLWFLALSQA